MKNRFWLVCLCLSLCCKINGQNITGTSILINRLFDVSPESFNALDVVHPWVSSAVLSNGKVAFVYQNYQAGISDAKLGLYDTDGTIEWTATIDHGVTDYGVKMEIDGNDNIYLVGASKAVEGDWDMFIEKYQNNGTLLYSTLYDNGDNLDEIPADLYVESGGSVLVTGLCQSDDGTNGINDDAFVAKFSNTLGNQWFEEYDEAAYSDVSVGMEVVGGSIFLAINSYSNATDRQRCLVKYDQSTGAFQNEVREASAGREYLTDISTFGNSIVTTGRKKVGSEYSGVLTSYAQSNLVQNWSTNFSGLGYGCKGMKLAVEGDYISWSCEAFDHKSEKMLFNHLVDNTGTSLIANRIEDRALDGITEIRAIEKLGSNFAYLIERGSISGGTTSYILFYDYGMKSIKKFVLGSNFSPANMHVSGSKISVAGYTIDPEDVNNVQGSCQLLSTYEFEWSTDFDTTNNRDSTEYLPNMLLVRFLPEVLNISRIDNQDFEYGSFYEFADTSVGDDFEDTTGLDLDSLILFQAHPGWKSTDTVDTNQYGRQFRLHDYYSELLMKLPNSVDIHALMDDMYNITNGFADFQLIYFGSPTHSMEPNDGYRWNDWQFSLHSNTNSSNWKTEFGEPGANIRILDAWKFSTGSSKVKVGVMEKRMAQFNHDDFTYGGNSIDYSAFKGGGSFDYVSASWIPMEDASEHYFSPHATQTAGVIGALRNNKKGVAGIAGGTGSGLDGVSLYSYPAAPLWVKKGKDTLKSDIFSDGLHILNNSWGSASNSYDYEGGNSYLDLYKSGVTIISARANEGDDRYSTPGTTLPDMTICVGALGRDGLYYKPSNTHSQNSSIYSSFGKGLDIMAPGARDAVHSTSASTYEYSPPTGGKYHAVDFTETDNYAAHPMTSGAAPHVSGVAALLVDYKFDHTNNINTLFPEDIEKLLELGAIDIRAGEDESDEINADKPFGTPSDELRPLPKDGYDDLTGWGRLDATNVMEHIKKIDYDIIHLDNTDNFEDVTVTTQKVATDVLLYMENNYKLPNILSYIYKCDVYEVEVEIDFSNILSNSYSNYSIFQLARYTEGGAWPIHSYTNLLIREHSDLKNRGSFVNYVCKRYTYAERVSMSKVNNTITLKGYVYHLKERGNTASNLSAYEQWFPFKAANASSEVEFGFSVHLVKDGVGIDREVKLDLSVYPNPFSDRVNIELPENRDGLLLTLYDMMGREMYTKEVDQGIVSYSLDLSTLPKGAYTLKVGNGTKLNSVSLIKR